MSDEDDPFESMEQREGDPFESLDGPDENAEGTDTEDSSTASEDPPDESGPAFEEEFIESDTVSVDSGAGDADEESFDTDPFGEMEGSDEDPFSGMGGGDGDPFGGADSAFEAVDIDALDDEELWEAIDSDDTTATVEETRYSEVSKHRFCEQCEFFAEPPASRCTHEEANILEYLDMEHVRVVNCPIVAEQRRIENEE